MNDTVLMVMSVRNIKSVVDSNNSLDCEKIYFIGHTEYELAPLINDFIKESNFKYYFITSDDTLIRKEKFELLKYYLQFYPIVSGWCVTRQNSHKTTIADKNKVKMNLGSNSGFISFSDVYYKTYEINKLPNIITSAFTGWIYTGMSKKIWEEYPFQTCRHPNASSDAAFSYNILKDGKYDQTIIKAARAVHISNADHTHSLQLGNSTDYYNFKRQIIKTF